MRIQEHSNKLETNVEAETQNFGIGDASVVIDILRNRLYEHKIRTLVQEYICNARDAMREVGKGNEFEITVPNQLNPVFKVRDFGPGITPERMKGVFVMYGSSTKRNTNSQTGGFGIGAKSAWSYTDSFTIVSVVDGIKRTYVAHTGVNNNGRLDLIGCEPTDETNGTEIQVGVKPHDLREFRQSIFRAIYFWEKRPTLLGELDPPTLTSGTRISPLVEIVDAGVMPEYIRFDRYNNECLAVIDGVPYKLTRQMIDKVEHLRKTCHLLRSNLVLHFGNGVVEVSASRESIADSPNTIKGLEKLALDAYLSTKNHIANAFKDIKTTEQWMKAYVENSKSFQVDKFANFQGYSIQHSSIHGDLLKKVRMTVAHCMSKRGRMKVDKITKEDLRESQKQIPIEHFRGLYRFISNESHVVQNKRLREYFKKHTHMYIIEPLEVIEFDIVKDKDGKETKVEKSRSLDMKSYNQVLKDFGVQDFSSITYVDPPRVKRVKVQRENEEICLHRVYGTRHKYTTLATNTQKWFYVPMQDGMWGGGFNSKILRSLEDYLSHEEGAQICGIAEKGLKMVKGDKNFIPLQDWLDSFETSKSGIKFAKGQAAVNGEIIEILDKIKDMQDEFLNEMVAEYKNISSGKVTLLPDVLLAKVNDMKEVKEFKKRDERLAKLMKDEYRLILEYGGMTKYRSRLYEEMAFYINAKYLANKKAK